MADSAVHVVSVGHVAVLTLNRLHMLNALDGELRNAMYDAVGTTKPTMMCVR